MYPRSEQFDDGKLEIGLWAEKVAQQKLEPYYPRRGRNKKLYFRDFTLSGRPDFIVKGCVVEVKKSSLRYRRPEWFAQLNLYLLMENKDLGMLLEVGNEKFRVTSLRFSPRLAKESIEYFWLLRNHLIEEEIPLVPRSSNCWFCSYRALCIKMKRGEWER